MAVARLAPDRSTAPTSQPAAAMPARTRRRAEAAQAPGRDAALAMSRPAARGERGEFVSTRARQPAWALPAASRWWAARPSPDARRADDREPAELFLR